MTARFRSLLAWLPVFLLVVSTLYVTQAMAGVYTVNPDRDSFMKEGTPNENNGTKGELNVSSNASNANRVIALYGFTLPAIPSNETITSATLRLWVRTADTNGLVEVRRITDTWTETTVNYANTGADVDSTTWASFVPSLANAYATADITGLVQGWANGTYANNGLVVTPTAANTNTKFTAREWGTSTQLPELVITTARIIPALTVVKSRTIVSDPYNNTTNPKAIPGALMNYNVAVSNSNAGTADSGTTIVTEAVPSNMRLYVNDLGGAGSGPVVFTNGSPVSGLTYTFTSLASTTDSIAFSNNGGSTYTYTPVPDANGYDSNVTHFRITPTGTFNGNTGSGSPSFTVQLRMQVK